MFPSLQEKLKRYDELEQQLAEAEDRWLSASETLEKQRFAAGAEDEETATR